MTLTQQPASNLPDNLPLLTQVADEGATDDLPTLTEIIPETTAEPAAVNGALLHGTAMTAGSAANEENVQRLLQLLEAHIENIFTAQLNINLEQMQRTAIQHAVNDLKAELPELLHEALNRRPGL